ncbi:MAG: class I SAM-dependent methyltransferase [Peptococcaceae bacterium]|nr:class I SAM-dependent methyltransferase [Peptococcaceae bacterium]
MNKIAVTTALRNDDKSVQRALKISSDLNLPFILRNGRSLDEIRREGCYQGLLVTGNNTLVFSYQGGEFFYHPGLSKLRIKEILNGKKDKMIEAMDLKKGDSVLDCTLGLGSDALVAAFFSVHGSVIGIESSSVLSYIVRKGMEFYQDDKDFHLINSMRRIKVVNADHYSYLQKLPNNSVDIVYFDPMFRIPGKKSPSMQAFKPLSNQDPLSCETIKEAIRVAKKRVVIKESANSSEFTRLGVNKISGSKYSPIAYGILEKGGYSD